MKQFNQTPWVDFSMAGVFRRNKLMVRFTKNPDLYETLVPNQPQIRDTLTDYYEGE